MIGDQSEIGDCAIKPLSQLAANFTAGLAFSRLILGLAAIFAAGAA